jgi:hypothetical protein
MFDWFTIGALSMTLNRKQRLIVILAASAVVVAMLFPPWIHNSSGGTARYHCIFLDEHMGSEGRIETTRLLIECVCISVASAVAFLFATVKPPPANAAVTPQMTRTNALKAILGILWTPRVKPSGTPTDASTAKLHTIWWWALTILVFLIFVALVIFGGGDRTPIAEPRPVRTMSIEEFNRPATATDEGTTNTNARVSESVLVRYLDEQETNTNTTPLDKAFVAAYEKATKTNAPAR